MKFETVLFALAFLCLGLISMPKAKQDKSPQASQPEIAMADAPEAK